MNRKGLPLWAAGFIVLLVLFCTSSIGPLLKYVMAPDSEETYSTPAREDDPRIAAYRPGNTVQALFQIEAQAARTGWTPSLHRGAGELCWDMGDLWGAAAHWEAAQPTDAALLERLARTYLALQLWPELTDTLIRFLKTVPDHPWAHYQLGLIQAAIDPPAAESHLRISARVAAYNEVSVPLLIIIQDNPGHPLVSMRVGLMLTKLGLWPQAELAFRRAAMVASPYPEALAYMALVRALQGKDGGPWMEQALTLDGDVAQVHYVSGLYLRALLDYEKSRAAFAQAVTLDPDNPAYYAELGIADSLLFDFEQAEHWLQTAITVSNNAPEFQQLLAAFYANAGNYLSSSSLEYLQQSADLVPQDPDTLSSLGWALFTMGDTEGALAEINAALSLAPENSRALYYKATILLDIGDSEQALPLLQYLAATDSPYTDWASAYLGLLGQDSGN